MNDLTAWRTRVLSCDGGHIGKTWREKFFFNQKEAEDYARELIILSNEENPKCWYNSLSEDVCGITGYCNWHFGTMITVDNIKIATGLHRSKIRESMTTEEYATVAKMVKALQHAANLLPKPGSGGERHITNIRTGATVATLTHYDPEVMDIFEALEAGNRLLKSEAKGVEDHEHS